MADTSRALRTGTGTGTGTGIGVGIVLAVVSGRRRRLSFIRVTDQ